jgi:hypothetical protein
MTSIINFLGPIFKWIALICLVGFIVTGLIHKKNPDFKFSKAILIGIAIIGIVALLIVTISILTST